MQPIPDDILKQFNAFWEQRAVSSSLRDDCRKGLLYYLDFRGRRCCHENYDDLYPLPSELDNEEGKEPAGFLNY